MSHAIETPAERASTPDGVKAAALSSMSPLPSPSGTTRLFVHIGHPIAQVQAPRLMNRLLAERQVDAVMVAIDVPPDRLSATVAGLQNIANLDGILVTVPHKIAICGHAQSLSPAVTLAGAANALRRRPDGRWEADNFDGTGFVEGLRAAGHAVEGIDVVLVGAGGAGTAIAASLVLAGVARVVVRDVDTEAAQRLVDRLDRHRRGVAERWREGGAEQADLWINATSMGMKPDDPLPLSVDAIKPGAVVADIVMKPAETQLLRQAAARGLATHAGLHMLQPQIAMYADFFLG